MQLAKDITDYYFAHIDELPSVKQFHFASRLHAWTGDERAGSLLQACKDSIVPATAQLDTLISLFQDLLHTPPQANMPAYALRKPYFEQYAPLYGLDAALFRLRHLEAVYGIDGRQALQAAMPAADMLKLEDRLNADKAAYRVLSTYAVNVSYLLHRVLLKSEQGINLQTLYDLGDAYDTTNPETLRLLIYLYTHSIIAETNYYVREIPVASIPLYCQMLSRIEGLLQANLENTSLDTKLEFLVCSRICTYDTPLLATIHQECAQSVSPNGTFIIDTHNYFKNNQHKMSFEASEHRNVLYIMSTTPFVPHAAHV